MAIDKKTVEDVAHLARIELEAKELEVISHQLEHILSFIDKLAKLNTDKVAPTNHILPVNNILRKDEPCQSLSMDQTLKNAPDKKGSFFKVPRVIE